MSVQSETESGGPFDSSKAVAQPEARNAVSIRTRVILGLILLWALGTALFIATHPPF
jgi:hypothetical protein